MVGNVEWRGISLAAVLRDVYDQLDYDKANLFVELHGADGYYAAVPLKRVIEASNDALLATMMNGEPLLPDHGFPVRAVIPGIVGARSVKWLERVILREGEGDSPWNRYYYKNKSLPLQADGLYPSCQSLPLNSLIFSAKPSAGDPRWPDAAEVSGVAYSGSSGEPITSVEVSADGGATWHSMELLSPMVSTDENSSKTWNWVQWRGTIATNGQPGPEVWCRAFTQGGEHSQPQVSPQRGGYLYNGWHKVKVA